MSRYTLLLLALSPVPIFGQAIVESAIAGAASSAAAPAAKGVGAASAGVFEALRKTLARGTQPVPEAPTVEAGERAASKGSIVSSLPGVERPSPEALRAMEPKDVSGIAVGLTRKELVEKYGQPALKTTQPTGGELVETYTYMQSKSDSVVVTLRDGIVAEKAVAAKPAQPSVITLR